MKCEMCRGNMTKKEVVYTGKTKDAVIVIKNIKALKCDQCGNEAYDSEEMAIISLVAKKVRESPFELAVTDAKKWRK